MSYQLPDDISAQIDRVVQHAEDNGWNAAINACRQVLIEAGVPWEVRQSIRVLYRGEEFSKLASAQES